MKTIKRSWTTRTVLALFATAFAAGCSTGDPADSERGGEAKAAITQVGGVTMDGCTAQLTFDIVSPGEDIGTVGIDPGAWAGSDLKVDLYAVDQQGRQVKLNTSAETMEHLIQAQSSSSKHDASQSHDAATSDKSSSSKSGSSKTASQSSDSHNDATNQSAEQSSDTSDKTSSLNHTIDSSSSADHSAANSQDSAAHDASASDSAVSASQHSMSSEGLKLIAQALERQDLSDGERSFLEQLLSIARDAQMVDSKDSSASQSASQSKDSSASQSASDQSSDKAQDSSAEHMDTAEHTAVNSSKSTSTASASNASSDSVVATDESAYNEMSESTATSADSSAVVDSSAADQSVNQESLDKSTEALDAFDSRTLVFQDLKQLRSRHLVLKVSFDGSIGSTNLDVFMGPDSIISSQLEDLLQEDFDAQFQACMPDTADE